MSRSRRIIGRRRGHIVVFSAFLMIVLVAMVAFSVDLGMILVCRTNLQRAVDAACLAAGDELTTGGKTQDVKTIAEYYLEANGIDVKSIPKKDLDIQFGHWDPELKTFTTENGQDATAIRIFLRQTNNRFYFAPVFGNTSFDSQAEAIVSAAMAGPQDIQLVIDRSGSMADYNRMRFTKEAAGVLLDSMTPNNRAGLAVYSWRDPNDGFCETGKLETSLDYDLTKTREVIDGLQPNGYTNIAGGMRVAIEEHKNNPRPIGEPRKVMVLLTDGRANRTEPPGTDPWNSIEHYANEAASEKITIHAITLGDDSSEQAMRDAAVTTGGTYHHIQDGDYSALKELFRQIGSGMSRPTLVH